jgi:hypothetical protein
MKEALTEVEISRESEDKQLTEAVAARGVA